MKNRKSYPACARALVGIGLLTASCALAQPAPTGLAPSSTTRPADEARQPQTVSGVVDGYNLDPRGMVGGVVIKDGDRIAQFNLPPGMAAVVAAAAAPGQKVTFSGMPEVAVGGRAIYRFSSLTAADGKKITMPRPGDGQEMHVEGTVARLNFGPRGEVDGAVLDGGDFLHVGPREAAQLNLAIGQKISVDGRAHPMLAGHNVIHATKVNGVAIDRPRPPEGGPRDGGGPGADGPRPMRDGRGPDEGPGPRGPRPMRGGGDRPGPGGPPDDAGRNGPPPPPRDR